MNRSGREGSGLSRLYNEIVAASSGCPDLAAMPVDSLTGSFLDSSPAISTVGLFVGAAVARNKKPGPDLGGRRPGFEG